MPPRRIFRFAYHSSHPKPQDSRRRPTGRPRDDDALDLRRRIHQLRDGDAFSEVAAVLYSKGYEYGGLLLNLPPHTPDEPPPIDLSFLSPTDLLVINTRPPLDDMTEEDKKKVPSSDTNLEHNVFVALGSYFHKCARSRIMLHERIARRLPEAFRQRADVTFHQHTDGSYLKYRGHKDRFWQKPDPPDATAFYLVRIPAVWENGPGLLAAFGMSGTETLVWSYLLRTRFPELVDSCEFLMAEVVPTPLPQQPTDLSFADGWEVTTVLRLPLHESAPARRNGAE